ncbi:MAG TPA: hypothetical protein VHW25_19125 [Steroidobacteraceae bacterium]|nr:hypothetical protein [Steroidobacteraceae bacterium]
MRFIDIGMLFTFAVRRAMATTAQLGAAARTNLRTCSGLLLFTLGVAASASSSAQEGSDPRIGTWEEQRISADFESLRRVIAPTGAGKLRLIVNAKLLEENRWHVDFSCDEDKYRILTQDGKFTGITYSCRRTGPRRFQFSTTRTAADPAVAPVASKTRDWVRTAGTETISEDGMRHSMSATLTFADGHQRVSRREFVRRR